MIQETSKLAYKEILKDLGERQTQVYQTLKKLGSASNTMISRELNLPINSVTPRIYELRKHRFVGVDRKAECPITNKLVIFWKCVR